MCTGSCRCQHVDSPPRKASPCSLAQARTHARAHVHSELLLVALSRRCPRPSPCSPRPQVRDILLELDGVAIGNDGTIQLPGTHDLVRVTFSYLVYRAARGHPLQLTVLRNHERMAFSVPAMPQPELLLVCKQPLPKPSYLIVGGLVFVPLMSP